MTHAAQARGISKRCFAEAHVISAFSQPEVGVLCTACCTAALAEKDAEIERLTNLLNIELDGGQDLIKEADALRVQRDALVAALKEIRDGRHPRVCAEYELCEHEGCRASYMAYVIADAALAAGKGEQG